MLIIVELVGLLDGAVGSWCLSCIRGRDLQKEVYIEEMADGMKVFMKKKKRR